MALRTVAEAGARRCGAKVGIEYAMAQELDAGLLVYRIRNGPEILLIKPGGPFWSRKDRGTWSIPKGAADDGDPLMCARRQFTSDTNLLVEGNFIPFTPLRQGSGKSLLAFAVECEVDICEFRSSDFTLEWPLSSGRFERFCEIERIRYFDLRSALHKIVPSQWPLFLEATEKLGWRLIRNPRGRE